MKCWDCGERVGVTPAVRLADGTIAKICVKCTNRWRPFVKHDGPADTSTEWTQAW